MKEPDSMGGKILRDKTCWCSARLRQTRSGAPLPARPSSCRPPPTGPFPASLARPVISIARTLVTAPPGWQDGAPALLAPSALVKDSWASSQKDADSGSYLRQVRNSGEGY